MSAPGHDETTAQGEQSADLPTEHLPYTVEWQIQVWAVSTLDAAEQALAIMRDSESTATVFTIISPAGEYDSIDLLTYDDEETTNNGNNTDNKIETHTN